MKHLKTYENQSTPEEIEKYILETIKNIDEKILREVFNWYISFIAENEDKQLIATALRNKSNR